MDALEVLDFLDKNKKDERIEKYLNSQFDSRVSKSIEAFKTNTLPGLVEKELEARTAEDPIKKREHELTLKEKAINLSVETNIPYAVILRQLSGDEEKDSTAISELVQFTEAVRVGKAEEMLAASAHKPMDSNSFSPSYSAKDLDRIPFKERIKLYKDGAFNTLLGRNK